MDDTSPACTPLRREPGGIDEFQIEGEINGSWVHATWDGCWLIASPSLLVRAQLIAAVDDAVAGPARMAERGDVEQTLTAERLLGAMVVASEVPVVGQCGREGRLLALTSGTAPSH